MSFSQHFPAKSYAPYSNLEEYCFVEGQSGVFYPGIRIENISYSLTISAVQGAICSCLGNNDHPKTIFQQKPYSELLEYWLKEFDVTVEQNLPEHFQIYKPEIVANTDVKKSLKDLTDLAVTIHSNFPVSALLQTSSEIIPGVNVEVQSWSLGLCAERLAVFRAVTAGFGEFEYLHIYAPKGEFSSPCGACRQVLDEWMPGKTVELHHGDGTLSKHTVSHLLPFGFTSNSLKK